MQFQAFKIEILLEFAISNLNLGCFFSCIFFLTEEILCITARLQTQGPYQGVWPSPYATFSYLLRQALSSHPLYVTEVKLYIYDFCTRRKALFLIFANANRRRQTGSNSRLQRQTASHSVRLAPQLARLSRPSFFLAAYTSKIGQHKEQQSCLSTGSFIQCTYIRLFPLCNIKPVHALTKI